MRLRCLSLAVVLTSIPASARAQRMRLEDVRYEAGEVEADPAMKTLTLRHHVVVVYKRYRLESEALTLRLTPRGIYVDGSGRVAFCPCADPPVTIGFSGARVAPPGELLLDFPRLEIEHVPAAFLPWIWVRSPDRFGLLPPQLAWRGDDGLFAGAGVHVPWRSHGDFNFVDLTGGGYFQGGAEVAARVETPHTTTHLLWDHLRDDRVLVDARGSAGDGPHPDDPRVAWDIDAVRGARARRGTIELEPAARPFDVGAAEASTRIGPALLSTGILARGERGQGMIVAGPESSLGLGGALGSAASWDFGATGAALGDDPSGAAIPLALAQTGIEAGTHAGPIALAIESRERARVAGRGATFDDPESSEDVLGSAAAHVGLPIARVFRGAGAGTPPIVHYVVPELEGRVAAGATKGQFFVPYRRPLSPLSWTVDAGLESALGRYGGAATSVEVRAGGYGRSDRRALPVAHGRLRATTAPIGLGVEAAAVGASNEALAPFERGGLALIGRARFGPEAGPNLGLEAATQLGEDARDARAVADGSAAALPADELAYLVEAGTTGAASVSIPWTRALSTFARLDSDLDSREVVAVRGDVAYQHTCGCLAVDIAGARRIGRGGVDLWVIVDLGPPGGKARH